MLRLLSLVFLLSPLAAEAQPSDVPGLLVMAHGGDEAWNAAVEDALAPLRDRYPMALAFGMADPASLSGGLDALAAQGVKRVAVVRLFLDGRSFLHQTEYFLGLREQPPARFVLHGGGDHDTHGGGHSSAHGDPQPIEHALDIALSTVGLMQAEEVAAVLTARATSVGTDPDGESVLVLAHGTGDDVENARWVAAMEHLTSPLRAAGYHAVRVETLREDWPEPRAAAKRAIRAFVAAEAADGRRVLVVPFRLAGLGPYRDVLDGLDYTASEEGILPHAAVTKWVDRQYHAVIAREGWDEPAP